MENLKVKVNNEDESKEVQKFLFELGYDYHFGGKTICNTNLRLVTANEDGLMANVELDEFEYKEITINQLRDMVVLKRNSADDATHNGRSGSQYYIGVESYFWDGIKWEQRDFLNLGYLKPIEKEGEVKMKEYLVKNMYGEYKLTDHHSGFNVGDLIEVPDGAEIFLLDKFCGEATLYFVKHDGEVFHEYYIDTTDVPNNTWIKCTIKELHKGMGEILWQRNRISKVSGEWAKAYLRGCEPLCERNPETPNTSIQEKLKFIEKWLNGEKIQYILGVESDKIQSEKTQWHNFTEGAMQYIKRSDIKFREAPKYVTINGIEFKSVNSLLKHVKNNFNLEDGE